MALSTVFIELSVGTHFKVASSRYVKVASVGQPKFDDQLQKSYNATDEDGGKWLFLPGEVVRPVLSPEQKRQRRNASARAHNQILRNTCGTSARAAKEDMGL